MTDTIPNAQAPEPAAVNLSPAPAAQAAPVEAVAPVAPVAPAPVVEPAQVTPQPAASDAPPVEAPAAVVPEPAPKASADASLAETKKPPETLLTEKPVEAPKPAEAVVVPEVKDEGGQTENPAPPPTYEPFTVPEGIQLDSERVGKFTELLSGLELEGKADHASVQAFGQKAVDFHIAEVNQAVENYSKLVVDSWEKQKNDWKEATIKDPDLGGNRLQTTLDAARGFIRTHGGTEEQQNEIRQVMETSGLGNHPVVIRLFANAHRNLEEGKPLAGGRPVPATKSKTQTLYGKG